MKIAYLYSRWSTADQKFGTSSGRQLNTALEWCKDNGYVLSEQVFTDDGKSGYKGDNLKEGGELKRFTDLMRDGLLVKGPLLIDSVDRFGRLPPNKATHIFTGFIEDGINLVFCGSYDKRIITSELTSEDDSIIPRIVGEITRAHRESAEKSRKIKAAKAIKKAEMQSGAVVCHNNIPKYFTFHPDDPTDKKNKRGKYEHNDKTHIVKELVDGLLAGKSLYEMATELNKRKIRTIRRKFQWSPTSIREILKNRVLIGEYLGNANYVKRIIEDDTFLKVQNILNQNRGNRGKKADLVNVFKSLTFCAECGSSVNALASSYKGVAYRYLRCSNYGKETSCTKCYLRLELVEQDFFHNYLAKNPYKLINGDDIEEVKTIQRDIQEKTARQNQVKQDIDKLIAVMANVSAEELTAKFAKLQSERDRLKHDIDLLNARVAGIQDVKNEFDDWAIKTIRFDEGEDGGDAVTVRTWDDIEKIDAALKDNAAREKLRVMLPSMVGKILIDGKHRRYAVLNRMGRQVYQSSSFKSQNNNTKRWRDSLKNWTTRKTAGGRVITCKRKA